MSIIELLFLLVLIGVGLYLLNTYVPMAQPLKMIINVIVVLLVIAWLLEAFGLMHLGGTVGNPRLK
jgi:hypothetical protein